VQITWQKGLRTGYGWGMARTSHPPLYGAARASFVADAARRAFALDPIANLAAVPELFDGPVGTSIYVAPVAERPDLELHAVGLGDGERSREDPPTPVRITVRAGAGRVALLLASPYAVRWEVHAERDVVVVGIFLVGDERSEARCNQPVRGIVPLANLPVVSRFDLRCDTRPARAACCAPCRAGTGRPLASFQGGRRRRIRPFRRIATRAGAGGARRPCGGGPRAHAPYTGAVLARRRRRDRAHRRPRRRGSRAAGAAQRRRMQARRTLLRRR
jgi:hypothetical protein